MRCGTVPLSCASGVVGVDMARHAASKAYKEAGVQPSDVDVVELHDCFSTNELLTYEALVGVWVCVCGWVGGCGVSLLEEEDT